MIKQADKKNNVNNQKQPAVRKTKTASKPKRFIYCGPNIPGGALQRYAVFKGGFPGHLDDLFDKCPAIKCLFVPVTSLAKAEQSINTKGTSEHSYFQDALQFIKKGGVR